MIPLKSSADHIQVALSDLVIMWGHFPQLLRKFDPLFGIFKRLQLLLEAFIGTCCLTPRYNESESLPKSKAKMCHQVRTQTSCAARDSCSTMNIHRGATDMPAARYETNYS